MKNFILIICLILISTKFTGCSNVKPAKETKVSDSSPSESQLPSNSTSDTGLSFTNKDVYRFAFNLEPSDIVNDAVVYYVGSVDNLGEYINKLGRDKKFIAYLSIGSMEEYRSDAKLLKPFCKKKYKGYSQECWLDLTKWRSYIDIMYKRIDVIRTKGYNAFYLDNCAMFSQGLGTLEENIEYLKSIARYSHFHGLKLACNNGYSMAEKIEPFMDFQVLESCNKYKECHFYDSFVKNNKPVHHLEFSKSDCKKVDGHITQVYNMELNKKIKDCN